MTAVDNTPSNRNFLSPSNFTFRIKKAPTVNFFVQKVNLPEIHVPNLDIKNEHVTAPYPGEHLLYGDLKLEFMVDEDLINYLEIHNWIIAYGKPQSYQQYKDISVIQPFTGEGIISDISLIITNSVHYANYEIVYTDAFPVRLSGIQFRTDQKDMQYLTAEATFKYTYYDIVSL